MQQPSETSNSSDVINIREIRSSDNEAIAKIIYDILGNEFMESREEIESMLPECRDLYSFYQQEGFKYFVIEYNGVVKGGAGIGRLKGKEELAELQKMYLHSDIRGKGFAALLLERCLKFARSSDYKQCYLDTRENMHAARKLYQKYGFKEVKAPEGVTGHHLCDTFYLLDL